MLDLFINLCYISVKDFFLTGDMSLNKSIRVCKLIDNYGSLLKENQLKLLKAYYFDDFTLSELADLQKVSRQAISESLNISVSKLEIYEQKLNKLKISEILENMTVENFEKSKQILKDLL